MNGTRYIGHSVTKNLLSLRAVSETCKRSSTVLPRIKLIRGNYAFAVLGFRRCQFPVCVCLTMTINKSQGQSVAGKLGMDRCFPCFDHGHLYVALFRAKHPGNVYVYIGNGQNKTKNFAYPKVITGKATKVLQCITGYKKPEGALFYPYLHHNLRHVSSFREERSCSLRMVSDDR